VPHASSHDMPTLDALNHVASRLKLGVEAPELHGSLCGYLAGGGFITERNFIERLGFEASEAAASEPLLHALFSASREALEDPDFGFEPLLPESDEPLTRRVQALLEWSRGFIGGFGLAAGADAPLSPESSEALHDLAKIASFNALTEDDEEAEDAFAEILEFVRIAALLLHGDCRGGSRSSTRLH